MNLSGDRVQTPCHGVSTVIKGDNLVDLRKYTSDKDAVQTPCHGVSTVPNESLCAYCTLGPIPVTHLDSALFQIEKQGWIVRFVVFSGMSPVASPIAMPGNPRTVSVPVYAIVSVIHYTKGDKVTPPVVDLSKQSAGNPIEHIQTQEGGTDEANNKGG